MEVFGGFMMMLSIIGFFLTVIWFILPFVIFNIKGRVDRTLFLVEEMEKRLKAMELSLMKHETSVRAEIAEAAQNAVASERNKVSPEAAASPEAAVSEEAEATEEPPTPH